MFYNPARFEARAYGSVFRAVLGVVVVIAVVVVYACCTLEMIFMSFWSHFGVIRASRALRADLRRSWVALGRPLGDPRGHQGGNSDLQKSRMLVLLKEFDGFFWRHRVTYVFYNGKSMSWPRFGQFGLHLGLKNKYEINTKEETTAKNVVLSAESRALKIR